MNFLSIPWLWMYAGAALILAEIFVPGCVVMFFGAGALATGLTVMIVDGAFPFWAQMLEFSVISIASLVAFRRFFMGALGIDAPPVNGIDDEFSGKIATVTVAVGPMSPGRVRLGDAEWDAVADEPIASGSTVRVVSRNNLTLKIAVAR